MRAPLISSVQSKVLYKEKRPLSLAALQKQRAAARARYHSHKPQISEAERAARQERKLNALKQTHWTAGESGNPHGRPKKEYCIPDIIREQGSWPAPQKILDELAKWIPRDQLVGLTQYRALVLRAWVDGQRGDNDARNFLVNRTEGKVMPMESLNADRTVIIVGDPEIKAEDQM